MPADLLSYAGSASAPAADKLAAVRGHVQAIDDMLAEAKRAEVEEAKQEAAYRFPKQEASGGLFTCGAQASPSSLPPYVPLTGGGFGCAAPLRRNDEERSNADDEERPWRSLWSS